MEKGKLLFSITAKDFRVDTFRCSGNGGQNVNKTSSGVRITHLESGATGESCTTRSQHENKREALNRLLETNEFKSWHRRKCAELVMKEQGIASIDKQVESLMQPHNIKVEVKNEQGRWVNENTSSCTKASNCRCCECD